nr:hypothetical protein [Tanacetum cinerariifolium]
MPTLFMSGAKHGRNQGSIWMVLESRAMIEAKEDTPQTLDGLSKGYKYKAKSHREDIFRNQNPKSFMTFKLDSRHYCESPFTSRCGYDSGGLIITFPKYPIDQSPPQEMSIQDMKDLKQHYLHEIDSLSNQIQINDYRNEKIDIRFRREYEDFIDELKVPPSIAITLILPTEDPEDSLIMGDEDLSTIPEKTSNEFIKSSIEDLVPIPSESEDTSESDSECDLPACDDFSPIGVPEGKFVTFSNPLFNINDDFTPSDDESLSDEDVPEDNVLEDIENKDPYDSDLDEPALLVTPLSYPNEDECFDPGGDIDDLMTEDKVFNPRDSEKFFSLTYVSLPFEDRHYLSLTYVIRIFLSYFTYPVESPFLPSSRSKDTIFDPDIYAFHFSSPGPMASHRSGTFMYFNVYPNILNESPIDIRSSTHFNPNITMIWGPVNFDTILCGVSKALSPKPVLIGMSMVPGVCWEVMEGRGGVVRRWWSGAEMGEVVLQGLAGIMVVNSSYLNRGRDNRDDIGEIICNAPLRKEDVRSKSWRVIKA